MGISQLGLIPPIAHLEEFAQGNFHLTLAHMYKNDAYRKHYQQQAAQGATILLDNGAWERQLLPFEELIDLAVEVGATELVLPDSLFNFVETISHLSDALRTLSNPYWFNKLQDNNIDLCFIPQGSSSSDWAACMNYGLDALQKFGKFSRIVLGIPRSIDDNFNGGRVFSLRKYMPATLNKFTRLFITFHAMGSGKDLRKLAALVRKTPYPIRSTDSAKPFTYAIHGIEITKTLKNIPISLGRPGNYFDMVLSDEMLALARKNVEIYKWICAGNYVLAHNNYPVVPREYEGRWLEISEDGY